MFMFIPNEIITEIINISDYQTWINQIKEVNQQYHSYYKAYDHWNGDFSSLKCRKHNWFVANWRHPNIKDDEDVEDVECVGYVKIRNNIYPICINSNEHWTNRNMISHIKLPHNY